MVKLLLSVGVTTVVTAEGDDEMGLSFESAGIDKSERERERAREKEKEIGETVGEQMNMRQIAVLDQTRWCHVRTREI